MEPDWLTALRAPSVVRGASWVLLEGQATVEAALAGWWEVRGVMIHENHPWEVPAWSGLEVLRKPFRELESLGDPARHGGVLGLARVPAETGEVAAFARSLESDALLVVYPRPADPVLAGNVARLAEEAGAAGVWFGAEGVSPFCPAAVAASAGALFRLPVRVADGGLLMRCMKAAAVDLSGMEPGPGRPGSPPPTGRRALVIGDPHLGAFWRAACDRRVAGDLQVLLRAMAGQAFSERRRGI